MDSFSLTKMTMMQIFYCWFAGHKMSPTFLGGRWLRGRAIVLFIVNMLAWFALDESVW